MKNIIAVLSALCFGRGSITDSIGTDSGCKRV